MLAREKVVAQVKQIIARSKLQEELSKSWDNETFPGSYPSE